MSTKEPKDPDELRELAADVERFMRLVHVSTRPRAKAVDEAGVGPFGGAILMTVADFEPLPVTSLARRLGKDKAQMTRAVQMLEERGLIQRARSAEDGRVSLVSLTDVGRSHVDDFRGAVAGSLAALLSGLDEDEGERFARLFRKVVLAHCDGPFEPSP